MHVVIGGGLAGISAALWLEAAGEPVTLVSFGLGGFALSTGYLDVYGYAPERVAAPLHNVDHAPLSHPYGSLSGAEVRDSMLWFQQLVGQEYFIGDPARNVLLPTAMGGLRPTSMYSPSCAAGIVEPGTSREVLVAGFSCHKDFQAHLCAGNLARNAEAQLAARAVVFDIQPRAGEIDASSLTYARAFDDPAFRTHAAAVIRAEVKAGETLLVPGLLGLSPASWEAFQAELGCPVAEIPLPPPNPLGLRLQNRLTDLLRRSNVRVYQGAKVVGRAPGPQLTGVVVRTAGHDTIISGEQFLLCAGGFESGALALDSQRRVQETVFGLPVHQDWGNSEPTIADVNAAQPVFASGLCTDEAGVIVDAQGNRVHSNLHAAGGVLAGAQRWHELNGEGIALATALRAAKSMKESHHG